MFLEEIRSDRNRPKTNSLSVKRNGWVANEEFNCIEIDRVSVSSFLTWQYHACFMMHENTVQYTNGEVQVHRRKIKQDQQPESEPCTVPCANESPVANCPGINNGFIFTQLSARTSQAPCRLCASSLRCPQSCSWTLLAFTVNTRQP